MADRRCWAMIVSYDTQAGSASRAVSIPSWCGAGGSWMRLDYLYLYGDGNREGRCGFFGAIAVMSGNSVRSTEPRVEGGALICYVENLRGCLSMHQGPEEVSGQKLAPLLVHLH